MVALDVRRALTAAGLDDVGIEGALDEEFDGVSLGLGGAGDGAGLSLIHI